MGDDKPEDKYAKGAFSHDKTVDDHRIVANPDVKSTDVSAADYDSWDWKQIKTAIYGGAALSQEFALEAQNLVNPHSLRLASSYLDHARKTMSTAADSVRAQADAVAGPDGPWQGKAAAAFLDKMYLFAKYLEFNAERINGGDAVGSGPSVASVPTQLNDNGIYLAWAQHAVDQIDRYWAAVAKARKKASVMDNGLIKVSDDQEVVDRMTQDMRGVLKKLAANYGVTIDNVRTPTSAGPDFGDTEPPPKDLPPGPDLDAVPDLDAIPGPDLGPDPGPLPDPGPIPDPGEGPALSDLSVDPPPPDSFDDAKVAEPPPLDSVPDADVPDPPATTIPDPGLTDPGLGNGPEVDAPPGSVIPPPVLGAPGAGGLPTPPQLKVPDTAGNRSGSGAGDPPPLGDSPSIADPPPLGDADDPSLAAPPATDVNAPQGLGDQLAGDNGQSDQDRGGVPPMMPPMSPGGSGGGSVGERSDASGLLGGPDAWGGDDVEVGVPDAPAGAVPGGSGVGAGVPPMMPPMSPGSPGGGSANERSDASGLLGGPDAWGGDDAEAGMPDAPAGAVPGGSGVGAGVPPMVPPMSPGGSGGGSVSERSDASGLLGGPDAWGGDDLEVGVPDAPAGAVPGGAGGPGAALPPMSPGSPGGSSTNERSDAADLLSGPDAWGADGPEADAPEGAVPGGFVVGAGGSSAGMPPGSAGGGSAGARSNASGRPGSPVPAEATRMSTVEQWEQAVMPMVPPPVTEDEAAVRSRASEHLREEPVAWAGGEELPLDRVAVVRREDVDDDTGAWDVAGSGVAWLTPLAVAGSRDAQRDGSAGSGYATWRRAATVTEPREDVPLRCGGPILTAEELAENRAEEAPPPPGEEETERTSADLLTRDDSAWGDGAAPLPGVLG